MIRRPVREAVPGTDIELVRKTAKQIGLSMQEIPEIAAEVMLPLKMQGIAEVAENAVVVPGARQVKRKWAREQGISLQTPVIVKYRDEKTDAATALESWLR